MKTMTRFDAQRIAAWHRSLTINLEHDPLEGLCAMRPILKEAARPYDHLEDSDVVAVPDGRGGFIDPADGVPVTVV